MPRLCGFWTKSTNQAFRLSSSVCNGQALPHLPGCSVRPSIFLVASHTSCSHSKSQRPFKCLNKSYNAHFTLSPCRYNYDIQLGPTRVPSSFQLLQRTLAQRPLHQAGAPMSQEMLLTMPGQNSSSFARPIIDKVDKYFSRMRRIRAPFQLSQILLAEQP